MQQRNSSKSDQEVQPEVVLFFETSCNSMVFGVLSILLDISSIIVLSIINSSEGSYLISIIISLPILLIQLVALVALIYKKSPLTFKIAGYFKVVLWIISTGLAVYLLYYHLLCNSSQQSCKSLGGLPALFIVFTTWQFISITPFNEVGEIVYMNERSRISMVLEPESKKSALFILWFDYLVLTGLTLMIPHSLKYTSVIIPLILLFLALFICLTAGLYKNSWILLTNGYHAFRYLLAVLLVIGGVVFKIMASGPIYLILIAVGIWMISTTSVFSQTLDNCEHEEIRISMTLMDQPYHLNEDMGANTAL